MMNDVTCPKCKKRFGWTGRLTDCPSCPKCGFQIHSKEWENDEKEIEKFRQTLMKLKLKCLLAKEIPDHWIISGHKSINKYFKTSEQDDLRRRDLFSNMRRMCGTPVIYYEQGPEFIILISTNNIIYYV